MVGREASTGGASRREARQGSTSSTWGKNPCPSRLIGLHTSAQAPWLWISFHQRFCPFLFLFLEEEHSLEEQDLCFSLSIAAIKNQYQAELICNSFAEAWGWVHNVS